MNNNQQQNEEYISMINYLISNLNKAKISPQSIQQKKASMPVFLFEFFVFELYLPRDIIRLVKQPIIACRLLDFPTLTLEGRVNLEQETIIFNQGKSSFFEMDLGELKNSLINQSMYIMFLDLNHGNMKIIGSCRLNISVFAYDSFLNFDKNSKYPDPRRNILQLFDNSTTKIGEFEISLLIRREYYKFDKNVEISENDKTVLIKKKKKNKENYLKQKNLQIFLKPEEKPKEKYIEKDGKQPQPQYYNNFVYERNDSAFNAHPVNKVVAVRSQSQSHITNQSQTQGGNKKKRKKSKNSTKEIQTDLIQGVKVPINYIDYRKGKSQNKKRNHYNNDGRQNAYPNNLYYNNQQFMQSNYNNGQTNPQYYMSSSNSNQFKYSNYSNNNFYNPNNFNNNNYYNQNNNNSPFYQSNGNHMMNNQNQNPINTRQMNNDNLNETSKSKSEPNEYLRLLSQIKNQVSTYKDKLNNEQINIKKVKQQRNINNSLNAIDQNVDNNENNNNDNNDNYNDDNNYNYNDDKHSNNNNNEEINNNNNEEIDNNNKFNNIQINKDDNINNNDINNNNIDIKPENIDNTEEEYKSDFIQNITESESNPAKSSSDILISNSKKDEKKADKDKQTNMENAIKEEEEDYDDFEPSNKDKKEEEEEKNDYDDFEQNDIDKKNEGEKKDIEDFDINKEDSYNQLETKQNPSSTNKLNNYNIDVINESNNEIEESINDDNDIKNKGESPKEKNPSIKKNSLDNGVFNEVNEESNAKINSNQNTVIKEGRSTSENLASSGKKSYDTNDLEELLK